MKFKGVFLVSALAFAGTSSSAELPVEVQLTHITTVVNPTQLPVLRITSLANEVHIEDVTVNRGNCQLLSDERGSVRGLPAMLVYGKTIQLMMNTTRGICDVREVSLETSQGDFTFQFKPNR